jgi:hypothetical protein
VNLSGSGPVGPARMRYTEIRDGVGVGDFAACDVVGSRFGGRVVHVWKDEDRAGRLCAYVARGTLGGLVVRWREGHPLAEMDPGLGDFLAFVRPPGPLLIHCAGGACRSPTLAVLALIARGRTPHAAVRDVLTAVWDGYGVVANLRDRPVMDIWGWCGLRPPWDQARADR